MSSPLPTTQSELEQGYKKLAENPQELDDKIRECQAKVDSIEPPSGWQMIGESLLTAVFPVAGFYFSYKSLERIIATQPAVREALENAAKGVGEVLDLIAQLASPGNPFAMKVMADQWDEVNRILTGAVGGLSEDKFAATTSWTDDMGQLYAKVPAGQSAALQGLLPHVENMRTFLREHADQILTLWWDLINTVVQFGIEAIPLASKFITGNPFKWVDMAQPIADAVAHVLTLVKDIVNRIVDFVMTSNQKLESFRAAASDVSGTDFGSWPVARLA